MNDLDFFLPINFISNEKEKKVFDEKHKKFKSIEELLNDKELIRAMAFINMVRRDGHIIDSIVNVITKIAKKAKINVQINGFADELKIDIEISKLRKKYLLKQKKLLNKNRSR